MNNKHFGSNKHNSHLMISAIAGLCIAGTALAQQEVKQIERRVEGSFQEPLESRGGKIQREVSSSAASQNSMIMMTVIEDDQTYSMKMINNEVSAQVNGKEVPQDRIRRKGNKIDILGEDGKVLHTFKIDGTNVPVAPVPPVPPVRPVRPVAPVPPVPPVPPMRGFAQPSSRAFGSAVGIENAPPVMIGMLMDYSDEDEGITVQRVFEGLPAEKSGLRAGDVIVRIEGKKATGIEVIRDALATKKPGEKLLLVVERDGDTKEIAIDLLKYDAQIMAKARGEDGELMPQNEVEGFRYEGMPEAWKELNSPGFKNDMKKALEEALEQVKKSSLNEAEQWKGEVVSSLQKALEMAEASSKEMRLQLKGLQSQSWHESHGGPTMIMRERPGQAFTIAPKAQEANTQMNAQLERLAESLERMNKRLEEMEKKLEKK